MQQNDSSLADGPRSPPPPGCLAVLSGGPQWTAEEISQQVKQQRLPVLRHPELQISTQPFSSPLLMHVSPPPAF